MTTWIESAKQSNFTIHHLPFGIFTANDNNKRVGVAIGDFVLDLVELQKHGFLSEIEPEDDVFEREFLNDLMALGKEYSTKLRNRIQELCDAQNNELKNSEFIDRILIPQDVAKMHLPIYVRDYTDFYSSIEHATNVGTMFRGAENALMPNWKHIPIGYHGRASSIIVSGENFHRPQGQKKPTEEGAQPPFGPSSRLDIELETAFITCKENGLGNPIPVNEAEDYIWGFALFNDWSARDIQAWEYVPLGPFLGKSFASSIAGWITPMQALEPFRVEGPEQDPKPLPYLQTKGKHNYDIQLEVWLETENGVNQKIVESNYKYMYWNMSQQLAHHSVNGCNIGIGDVYGSGTISGKDKSSYGSLLELSWGGKEPIELSDGSTRTFLEDGDTVVLKGYCEKGELRIGLGEVRAKILPAKTSWKSIGNTSTSFYL